MRVLWCLPRRVWGGGSRWFSSSACSRRAGRQTSVCTWGWRILGFSLTYLYLQSNLKTRSSEPSLSLVFLLSTARSYFIRIRGRLCPENKLKQFQPEKPLDFDVPGVFTRACWFSATIATAANSSQLTKAAASKKDFFGREESLTVEGPGPRFGTDLISRLMWFIGSCDCAIILHHAVKDAHLNEAEARLD